ncbi:MAG: HAMP domain-containing sensor histidine kinase [Gemmatimonadaceae bacterium]
MTIRGRLALGLFAIALVLIAPLALALHSLSELHDATRQLQNREFAASLILGDLRARFDDVRRTEDNLALFPKETSPATLLAQVDTIGLLADTLKRLGVNGAAFLRGATAEVAGYATREYDAAIRGRGLVADSVSTALTKPALARADTMLTSAELTLRGRMGEAVNRARERSERARQVAVGAFLVAATLTLVIAVLIWRGIARPISDLETGMAAVADGSFGHRLAVSPDRGDEFGKLSRSFESMAEQLAQLDRLKAEFVSVASHELKTPINVVLGYVQLLEEEVYGSISPKQREVLKTLETQTRSLARLVHQLLDVSRFEAGGGKLELRTMPLDGFLDDLEEGFRVLALQRGVTLRVTRSPSLPADVQWDSDRMNEVLGNLLSNAFKFTERGGTVELRADGVDRDVHIEVRDSGAGIPPDQLPRIFEKFYQADNQSAAAQVGSGLGLAIAQQILKAHSGSIMVDSTVGVGTVFYLVIPARAGARSSGPFAALSSIPT